MNRVICLGDSLTAGYGAAPEDGWISLLSKRFSDREWINMGVCGEGVEDILDRAQPYFSYPNKKDSFFFMGGTNDILCGFRLDAVKNQLEKGIAQFLENNLSLYVGIPPLTTKDSIASGWQPERLFSQNNEALRAYGHFIKHLSLQHHFPVIDFQAALGAHRDELYADGVHPNAKGYKLFAETASAVFACQ